MRVSPRLRAVYSLIKGNVLADIGTDHGFLPIFACLQNEKLRAVACDFNQGPLERAKENIKQYGLENRIDTRLGFGIEPLGDDETECVVIAGMGGMNIVEILKEPRQVKRLILQPQRDLSLVKDFVTGRGYVIINEITVEDRGRKYTVIGAENDC